MRKIGLLVALLAPLVFLAACSRSSGTVEIPPEELPFNVARSAPTTGAPAPTSRFTLFFIRADRLVGVSRQLSADGPPAEVALRALLVGTRPVEARRGIGSELSSAVRLLDVEIVATTAVVDLSGEFQEPAAPDRIALRVAQVVWTLTELPGVTGVRFVIDGEPVAIAVGDGTVVERAVLRADYPSIAPA